jgi:hypothetical protein
MIRNILDRIYGKYQRALSSYAYRRPVRLNGHYPIISFSFDDAPQTAFNTGGDILLSYGARATFYVSLGLLCSDTSSGRIASLEDLRNAITNGHELGCHTYDHLDAWNTVTDTFFVSVKKNKQALVEVNPDISFTSLSYPINRPRPSTKKKVGQFFNCCRGGGQTFNEGIVDLNLLKACFIDIRNNNNIDFAKKMIDKNVAHGGWLIFVTHDVTDNPSRYGCTKIYFKMLVAYASSSGANILPVSDGCNLILRNSQFDIVNAPLRKGSCLGQ